MSSTDDHLQVDTSHYFGMEYNSKERFICYWHQINEILSAKPDSVLEIGKGNGIVSNFLRGAGLPVTTCDIDERLNPDVCGSVISLPFPDRSFDMVTCFQTLEHLPFGSFHRCLSEIHRVSKKHALISLPQFVRVCSFNLHFPFFGGGIRFVIPLPPFLAVKWFNVPLLNKGKTRVFILVPAIRPPQHVFDGQHYWEIGKAEYPLPRICGEISHAGFAIVKTFRILELPNHRFFLLTKV